MYSPESFKGELQPHTSEIITKQSYTNHPPGVEIAYHAISTNKRPMFFLEKRQSLRPYRAVTNLEYLQLETIYSTKQMMNQEPFHMKSPRRENFTKIGQTMFELENPEH